MRLIIAALLGLLALDAPAQAQSVPRHYLSAATTNSTLMRAGKGLVKVLLPINTTSTTYFLKLYDKATAPTCGTDTPVLTIPVPNAAGAGGGVALPSADGLQFFNGVGFCLTGGIADNDTTSAATGIALNFGLSGN